MTKQRNLFSHFFMLLNNGYHKIPEIIYVKLAELLKHCYSRNRYRNEDYIRI